MSFSTKTHASQVSGFLISGYFMKNVKLGLNKLNALRGAPCSPQEEGLGNLLFKWQCNLSLHDPPPVCNFKPSTLTFWISGFYLMPEFCLFVNFLLNDTSVVLSAWILIFLWTLYLCCISCRLRARPSPLLCPTWVIPSIT